MVRHDVVSSRVFVFLSTESSPWDQSNYYTHKVTPVPLPYSGNEGRTAQPSLTGSDTQDGREADRTRSKRNIINYI